MRYFVLADTGMMYIYKNEDAAPKLEPFVMPPTPRGRDEISELKRHCRKRARVREEVSLITLASDSSYIQARSLLSHHTVNHARFCHVQARARSKK
jgi:hypothetical protein